jgi:hypothetical protein
MYKIVIIYFHCQKSLTVTVVESIPEDRGSLPGGVTFETIKLCRRSSTFVKYLNKFDGDHLRSSTLALRL